MDHQVDGQLATSVKLLEGDVRRTTVWADLYLLPGADPMVDQSVVERIPERIVALNRLVVFAAHEVVAKGVSHPFTEGTDSRGRGRGEEGLTEPPRNEQTVVWVIQLLSQPLVRGDSKPSGGMGHFL